MIKRCLAFTAALTALTGCGGGGGGLGSSTVSVTASPTSIGYGATSKIKWSAKNSASFESSNFGLDGDNFHSGSITDTPGTTTTYSLRVGSDLGNSVSDSVKVTVARLSKNVLVVGDAAQAGPAQIQDFVRTLTTGAVTVAASVPTPSNAYGILIVSPTAVITTSEARNQVKSWLDAGKGIVLCGRAPSVLATGVANNQDVSTIGSWFFGVNTLEAPSIFGGGTYDLRSSSDGLVNLSATIRGKDNDTRDIEGYITGFGPQVDGVATEAICAYVVPTGGRLLYSGSPVGYGNEPRGAFQQAFESSFRWVGQ